MILDAGCGRSKASATAGKADAWHVDGLKKISATCPNNIHYLSSCPDLLRAKNLQSAPIQHAGKKLQTPGAAMAG
jgi:hypothetical protein